MDALKKLTLTNTAGKTLTVTDVTSVTGDSDYYAYMELTLSDAVSAGKWSTQYEGTAIGYSFTVDASPTEERRPYLYSSAELHGSWSLRGVNLPTGSTYTARIYQGYECLSKTDLKLTLTGENDGSTQGLKIKAADTATLKPGEYQVRVYIDGSRWVKRRSE